MLLTILSSLLLLVNAQPLGRGLSVEPVEDCSLLPAYNEETRIAGPWTVHVDSCYNGTATDGRCTIEGFGSSSDVTRQRGDPVDLIKHGFITIVSSSENVKTQLRCNGTLNRIEAYVPAGPDAYEWQALGINHHPSTGRLVWGRDFEPVHAYRHYRRGQTVDGIFLGANKQTNWAVHSSGRDVSIEDFKPYWVMRLMIPETTFRKNEFHTLIRIDGS
ncbi:unnamed protein product [Penicillium olsonii]|nr:unnamed protein product [Penicillium olsonii]